jgi:catechol 2,3-dioxygenase-like lactoylglutathione lyase family enzyme
MFSHVMIGANNIEAAKKFYDSTLGTLGIAPGKLDAKGRLWYSTPEGLLGITKPINGQAASCGNGSTIGFKANSPKQLEEWHAAGVANGGVTCEDPPGIRQPAGIYLAYLRDPAGNKLCALHRPAV